VGKARDEPLTSIAIDQLGMVDGDLVATLRDNLGEELSEGDLHGPEE
jgi:hypothetical protein